MLITAVPDPRFGKSNNDMNTMLRKVQGHIVEGHGGDHVAHFFITFKAGLDPAAIRDRIAELGRRVTPGDVLVHDQRKQPRERRDPSLSVWAVGISYAGYSKMGLRSNRFPPDFIGGFAQRAPAVAFSDPAQWTDALWKGPKRYDALVIFASRQPADDHAKAELQGAEECVRSILEDTADFVRKDGFVKRNADRRPVEHFGFVDGVSHPVFFRETTDAPKTLTSSWRPDAGFRLALVDEMFPAAPQADEYGSYCAFVTIQQHVDKFQQAATILQQQVGSVSIEDAQQLIVGRPKSGNAPVFVKDGSKDHLDDNDFDPKSPGVDRVWPYACHTRKMNPRDGMAHRRIVRRGVLYQEGDEVGLLFQSFQASLSEQFEFLLKSWANVPSHAVAGTGMDPIAGALSTSGQTWPMQNGTADKTITCCVSGLTTIKGGDYFYFPSIPSLQALPKL